MNTTITFFTILFSLFPVSVDNSSLWYNKIIDRINNLYMNSSCSSFVDTTGHPDIDTLLQRLDPFSNLIIKNEMLRQNKGIGIEFTKKDSNFIIFNTLPNSPAQLCGLKSCDKILELNNIKISNLEIDSVCKIFRSNNNDSISLKIARAEYDTFIVTMNRNNLTQMPVEIIKLSDCITYLKIRYFFNLTPEKVSDCLSANKSKFIIIDLRNNRGGTLASVTKTAELFVKEDQPILITKGNKCDRDRTLYSTGAGDKTFYSSDGDYSKLIICIITNNFTSAGAEAFALALREQNNAVIIGNKTLGAATVQRIFVINDSLLLKLTTHEIYSSKNIKFDKVGITPDITVPADTTNLPCAPIAPMKDRYIKTAIDYLMSIDKQCEVTKNNFKTFRIDKK